LVVGQQLDNPALRGGVADVGVDVDEGMLRRWANAFFPAGIALVLLLGSPSAPKADELVYVVAPGDALSRLARQFGVSVQEIRQWNGLRDDLIVVGQELRIHRGEGERESASDSGGSGGYIVQPGDTVGAIARRHEVTVADLVSWNRGLDPDRIRVGQELTIRVGGRSRRRVTYEVQPGDFVARVARRYGISVNDIANWNPGLDVDRVRIGQELLLFLDGPEVRSASIGRANDGRLVGGEQLPEHAGYVIRNRDIAWGTNETVAYILDGFDAVRRRHPSAPRVRMHDLSDEDGGRLRGHRSHQSGRDADIGYYQRRCRGTCEYRNVRPSELDVELQWALIRHWINNSQIDYIFMDYSLQEPLYEYVRDVRGATAAQLNEWFQYPHGRRTARGLIRHEPNHRDHIHVRFACSDDDDRCR
jgi:LysM repeat protein/murein endopeptidase